MMCQFMVPYEFLMKSTMSQDTFQEIRGQERARTDWRSVENR